ncbi:DUF5719 family protein [Cellulomonas triticagri]|uniref:DUF5719 family protein n=1 Tax=Cellulomonas triticagri TaxID=2483352 RepID=UPI0013157E8F|nr:DUF5719 family protein [Cellulomonas triticagri]
MTTDGDREDVDVQEPTHPEVTRTGQAGRTSQAGRGGRVVRILSGLLVLGLTGGVVALAGTLPASPAATADALPADEVDVAAAAGTLVCPGPLRLPDDSTSGDSAFDRVPVAPVERVTVFGTRSGTVSLTPLGGSAQALDDGATVLRSPTAPVVVRADPVDGEPARVAGATASVVADGDLRGLSAASCARPASNLWLVGGSTEIESSADLVLVNPGATAADVTVEAWGPAGPVDLGSGATQLVAPGDQRTLVLPGVAAEQRRLVVHVSAAGGQVSAYLQDSLLDGFTPRGTDLVVAGSAPAAELVVPGVVVPAAEVDDPDAGALRLLVPGEEDATVSVRLLGPDGETELPGAQDLALAAGEVTDLSLGGIGAGAYTAVVESDVPVVAAATTAREGEAGDLDAQPRLERAWSAATATGGGLLAVPDGTTGTLTIGAVPTGVEGEREPAATPSPEPTEGQRPDPDAGTAPQGPVVTATVRAYGATGRVGEQEVEVPVGSTVRVLVADLGADVTGIEVVTDDDPRAEISWALLATANAADGPLLSVLTPLVDTEAVTSARVREASRLGVG